MFDDDLVTPCIQYSRVCVSEDANTHAKEDVIIDSRRSNLIQWQYDYISDLGLNFIKVCPQVVYR
jgi:hypothetical protein